MWCFIFSYAHQEFSVQHSVKLDAKTQMGSINNVARKMAPDGMKVIYIPRKISVLKFAHAVSAKKGDHIKHTPNVFSGM